MKQLITAILCLAFAGCARGDLVEFTTGNLQSGSIDLLDANGTGLNLRASFTGDFTDGTGSIANAGFGLGGVPSTFGWEGTVTSGVFHILDPVFRIEALNGTFDGNVGWEKQFANVSDNLFFTTDGVWDNNGQTSSTISGGLLTINPNVGQPFVSGIAVSSVPPSVTGATFIELSSTSTLAFSGAYSQDFDLNITSTTPVSVPEPSAIPVLAVLGAAYLAIRRKRRG